MLLVTRPAAEARRTAAEAEAAGFVTLVAPLLEIEPLDWELPGCAADALLFTSARAPALAVARVPDLVLLPAYAVGRQTAAAARAAGFAVQAEGEEGATAIAAQAAAEGVKMLLQLGGEDRAPMQLPHGVQLVHVGIYAARRLCALPADAEAALRGSGVFATLLFSARTARHFAALVDEAGLDRSGLRLVVLSEAVARGAGDGWRAVAVGARPDLAGALAAARALWQGGRDG